MGEGIQIRLDITRDDITPALRRLASLMGSLKTPLSQIGDQLVTSTKRRFETSTGPEGEPWAPLSPITIAGRRTGKSGKHSGVKPLIDTGTLLRSIKFQATSHEVAIGTNHELAPGVSPAIHQLGGQAGRNHGVTIPARPFLGIDSGDADMITDVIARYLGSQGHAA